MNDQPNSSQFRAPSFGAPPPSPSGSSRLLPLMRTAATGGLIVAIGLYAAQLLLPENLKPSVVAGRAAGDTVRSETEAMREVKLDYERRLADATAQANAKAQADVIAIQKTVEERTQGLAGQSTAAALSDWACIGGHIVSNMTQPRASWGQRNAGDDWYSVAQNVSAATCGLGDTLRENVTQSQLAAVREAAAARGAPMTNGGESPFAVRNASQRDQGPTPSRPVDAAASEGMTFSPTQVKTLRDYADTLPDSVRKTFSADIPANAPFWEVFSTRVVAYQYAHQRG